MYSEPILLKSKAMKPNMHRKLIVLALVMITSTAHAQTAADGAASSGAAIDKDALNKEIQAYVKEHMAKQKSAAIAPAAKTQKAFVKNSLKHPYDGKDGMTITDDSPLIKAMVAGDVNAARSLLKSKKVNVNQATKDGSSALIVATIKSTAPMVQTLISYGADVVQKDAAGLTALHYAAIIGDVDKIRLLASLDPLVDRPDAHGVTPVFYAYINDQIAAAQLLINEFGARINQPDSAGNPLAFLVVEYNNNPAVTHHMITQKLNLFKRNSSDQSLIDVAKKAGNKAVAKELQTASDEQIKAFLEKQKAAETAAQKPATP